MDFVNHFNSTVYPLWNLDGDSTSDVPVVVSYTPEGVAVSRLEGENDIGPEQTVDLGDALDRRFPGRYRFVVKGWEFPIKFSPDPTFSFELTDPNIREFLTKGQVDDDRYQFNPVKLLQLEGSTISVETERSYGFIG
jgi:hypothetical protein